MSLIDKINTHLSSLMKKYDVKIKKVDFDNLNFGNELIVLEAKFFLVRFIRDRGSLFVDIAPTFLSNWYSLNNFLTLIQCNRIDISASEDESLKKINTILIDKYDRISDSFTKENFSTTKIELDIIEESIVNEMFSKEGDMQND